MKHFRVQNCPAFQRRWEETSSGSRPGSDSGPGPAARAADERAVKSRVTPIYPEVAKRMKIRGAVKLVATVDAQGK